VHAYSILLHDDGGGSVAELINRWQGNPILESNSPALPGWACEQVRNPGAVWDGSKVRLLFTTVKDFAKGGDFVLGYAQSDDGYHFTASPEPFMVPPSDDPTRFDCGGLEDTRITRLGDDYYIAYAGRSMHPVSYWTNKHDRWDPQAGPTWNQNYRRVGLAKTRDWKQVEWLGPVTSEEVSDANVVLFPEMFEGKYAMLHRPTQFHPGEYQCFYTPASLWIAFSDSLTDWHWNAHQAFDKWNDRVDRFTHDHMLIRPEYDWERLKVGAAGVPMATDEGWLMLYHAVDLQGTYRVGLLLLDRDDPRRVVARSPEPIMSPCMPYEQSGHYKLGKGCIFPCANVVIGDEVFIYYGAADSRCCVATVRFKDLLDHALKHRLSPVAQVAV